MLELVMARLSGVPGLGVTQTSQTQYERIRGLTGLSLRWQPRGSDWKLALASHVSYGQSELQNPLGEVALARGDFQDEALAVGTRATVDGVLEETLFSSMDLMPQLVAELRYERFTPDAAMVRVTPSQRLFANAGLSLRSYLDSLGLETMAALGYEHARSEVDAPEYLLASTAGAVVDAQPYDALTWHLGAVWRASESSTFNTNLARAVRMPNLFELFGNSGTVRGNPALLPEEGINLDVGFAIEHYLAPGRTMVAMSVMGFVRWTEGLIQFSQNAQNVALARNVESAELRGVELSGKVHTLDVLRVSGTLTGLQTRNKTEVAAREGKSLPRRPALQAFLRTELYWHPGGLADEVSVEATVEHTRGNFLDDTNLVAVPARWLVGSALRGRVDDSWDASLQLRNLLDSRVQDLSGFPLPGRTFMMTLRYRSPHTSEGS